MYRLLSDRLLWWKEPILASCSFRGFQRTLEKPKAEHSIFERLIREAKNSSAKWPGGHKSNAEPKHIYCSFISIHSKLNLSRATGTKPQFASKFSSWEVSNSPRPHQPWHTTVENQLGNPTLFQTEPRWGPYRQLSSINCFRTTGPLGRNRLRGYCFSIVSIILRRDLCRAWN